MTGKYNVRNYIRFATLDRSQDTFGHAFRNAGYRTAIVGKWQLGGTSETIHEFGFDEHCLWHIRGAQNERYVSPTLLTNGKTEDFRGQYGPDLQQAFAKDFIKRHQDEPFFLYYPVTLPHYPFQPTPDSPHWDPARDPWFNDTRYFGEMVTYLDKLVGELVDFIRDEGLADNTLVIFTSDNGTDHRIISLQGGVSVKGAKGKMTVDATHVPFFAIWPGTVPAGLRMEGLIDFSDVYATLIDLAGISIDPNEDAEKDGISFLPLLKGEPTATRDHSFCWYMERTDMTDIKTFVQNTRYKLHSDGRFINKAEDRFELHPLSAAAMSEQDHALKGQFSRWMSQYDALRPVRIPYNHDQPFAIPGKVEVECYDYGYAGVTYHDTTEGNSGKGFYRSDDVDIVSEKGRHRVTNTESEEWLEYSVDIKQTGTYKISVCYAGTREGIIRFEGSGQTLIDSIALKPTGAMDRYESVRIGDVSLEVGRKVLRLHIEQGGMQLDHFTIIAN
jgi:arylsulfatase A